MKKFANVLVVALVLFTAETALADTLTFSGAQDISIEATDSSGANVTFDVTATDASSTPFTVTCIPPSGSLFPIGTTTVACEAADNESATSTTSFDVGVFEVATPSPIATSTPLNIEGDVDVPANCDILDTDGTSHHYEATSSSVYVGICALQAAKDSHLISGFEATNFSFGLFVTSVHGTAADPSSQFWALYHNDTSASVGLSDLPIVIGDTIVLQLHDFSDNNVGDQLTLHIRALIATSTATSTPPDPLPDDSDDGGGGGGHTPDDFDINAAVQYLAGKQNANGSFSSDMITDWIAIGLASVKSSTALSKIKTYEQTATPKISSVTDAERHAMALQALGINPYTGTSVDYIAPIVAAFDGTQIGDSGLDNDDIFALFPLLHAGYSSKDVIIQKTAAFILSKQKPNGSWDESPDMTAAAIDALGPLYDIPGVNPALGRAVGYLMSTQKSDGGWETIDSTSWVQTAINGILAAHTPGFDSESDFASSAGNLPTEALADAQEGDGGVRPISDSETNRTWSTGYALLAASGKDWSFLLKSFNKPAQTTTTTGAGDSDSSGGGSVAGASTSTLSSFSTTTMEIATSTLAELVAIGTSTLPVAVVKKEIIAPYPTAKLTAETSLTPEEETASSSEEVPLETSVESQTAAAGASENFFARIWHALVEFFKRLFGL